MTTISERAEHCPARREALGNGLSASAVQALRTFVAFAADQGARHVTAGSFLLRMEQYGSVSRKSWSYRLSHARTFAIRLQMPDPEAEVPTKGLIPAVRSQPRPYIYTDEETTDLVEAAARLHSPTGRGLRGTTYATLFGLLALTGLRISEALRLDDDDVDAEAATLRVRHARKHIRRVIPLAPCTAERLAVCQVVRDMSVARQAPTFFLVEHSRREEILSPPPGPPLVSAAGRVPTLQQFSSGGEQGARSTHNGQPDEVLHETRGIPFDGTGGGQGRLQCCRRLPDQPGSDASLAEESPAAALPGSAGRHFRRGSRADAGGRTGHPRGRRVRGADAPPPRAGPVGAARRSQS